MFNETIKSLFEEYPILKKKKERTKPATKFVIYKTTNKAVKIKNDFLKVTI